MNKKKVVLSKAQYDLLSNIFSIKVDGECLFENVEGGNSSRSTYWIRGRSCYRKIGKKIEDTKNSV